ncbi:hypothetical protein [Streptomyces sp. NPDC058045]|uniref:hypothetical protein n=1 Tax=Streptomyces sp. NPDC058045 TaxID=3346311 RepID=UPI0036E5341B
MPHITDIVGAHARRSAPSGSPSLGAGATGTFPLAVLAAAFVLAQLLLVPPHMGLGWDETVYVSQTSPHAPAAYFSAPRSRGTVLLTAPVTAWTGSTTVLRIYLTVLAGLTLYLALRMWRPVVPGRVLLWGGGLFCTLWITLFYAPQAMPNYWVATAACAAVAGFVRAWHDPGDRAAHWVVAGCCAAMALLRPTDSVWLTLPFAAVLLLRRPLRPRLALAWLGGLAVGAADWVVEAYVSYGGLSARLAEGARVEGGMGPQFAVGDQLRSLGGRLLCRPCVGPMPATVVTVWWYVLPLLALAGLLLAPQAVRVTGALRGSGVPRGPSGAGVYGAGPDAPRTTGAMRLWLPLACAATAAVPYLFLIGYAAPRFLLPTYLLLCLPAGYALAHVFRARRGRRGLVTALVVAALLGTHVGLQLSVLLPLVRRNTVAHQDWQHTADALHRLGVRPPCTLTGNIAVPIAYYTGCGSAQVAGPNASTTPAGIESIRRRMPIAALVAPGGHPPSYAAGWPAHRITGPSGAARYAYVAPRNG